VLGFRLGLEFVRVRDRVRKWGPVWRPICVGPLWGLSANVIPGDIENEILVY